ncbi:MAG TPA: DUF3754 domain-containing protein [Vitreimonas sp.]|uniref:DUF3754 domain-containing protein n=1 Tax=Vitreimonas sp. TaxID=3069702 RepID=UPI002D51CF7C|nr:DUF3754 domain-containing protein [Vitreimonas sp.]HYD89511.1 DUF3754 domain-containing protein [Vitreimonas sp.]
MSEPSNSRRDGFIAARKRHLAESIAADSADGATLREMLRLLGALLHHEAHERLDALKALYDPLDPDAPPATRDVSAAAFETFEAAFCDALMRANFQEIDPDTVQTRRATKQLTGLAIKPSSAGIRRVRFFARGVRPEKIERRSWFGLRRETVHAEVMNDVVVLVGFKAESEIGPEDAKAFASMRRGVRPGAALVKHFRSVATPELVTLHPGAKPSMRPRDQVILAAPAIATGVPVLLNIWPAITVIFAVLAAYFGAQGAIEENELKRALAAVSGLVAVGAFVMRQRLKYEAQTLRYQKQLADTVYFRNLANNAGVLDLLVGAGEDQDAKEAFLAYAVLRASERPLVKAEIDNAAEAFLQERFGLDVDFEINDALAKIERLGLVTREEQGYRAIAPAEALAKLDAAWDDLFSFSARR